MKASQMFKLWLRYRWGVTIIHRKLRRKMRKTGLHIYATKLKAINRAKGFTFSERRVFWVVKEEIGYYVIHLEDIARLNSSSMKQMGGTKIQTKYLDKICVWRSPKYSTL